MKNGHVWMYLFLLILAGILLRNAAGTIGLMLAGGSAGSQFVGTLEGPAKSTHGSFRFGKNSVSI